MLESWTAGTIRLVLFDLAGTTVHDGCAGGSLVVEVLGDTLRSAGVAIADEELTPYRGIDHAEAVSQLLRERRPGVAVSAEELAALLSGLLAGLQARIVEMAEIPGTADTFRFLHERGIKVGVGSGFRRQLVDAIVARFRWRERGLVDYVASTEDVGAGRPDPAMIRDAMARFQLTEARQFLKVGDTVVDVQEGRNAGVWTAAVLTGTQGRAALAAVAPDFLLESVAELPALFHTVALAGAGSEALHEP